MYLSFSPHKGPQRGMEKLGRIIKRESANDCSSKIYKDAATRFYVRLYTPFDVDLKRIRLRSLLHEIVEKSDIYNIAKVSKQCFLALHYLQRMCSSTSMRQIKDAHIFPTVDMLLRLESKYGEVRQSICVLLFYHSI